MKKRYLFLALLVVALVVGCFAAGANDWKTVFSKKGKAAKQVEKELQQKEDGKVLLKNKNITVTSDEIREETELLSKVSDMSEEEIIDKSVDQVIEINAVLQVAESKGYRTTEKEFEEYKKELSDSLEEAENADEVKAYIDGFGGLDQYFKAMEDRLKDRMTVRAYLDDQKSQFAKESGQTEGEASFEEVWNEKEKKLVSDIVKKANVSSEKRAELEKEAKKYVGERK